MNRLELGQSKNANRLQFESLLNVLSKPLMTFLVLPLVT